MTQPQRRAALTIVFAGLLVGPAIYLRFSPIDAAKDRSASRESNEAMIQRYGFALVESSAQAKLEFTHEPPRIDSQLQHIEAQIGAMGASISVVDFDRDGWQDLYVTSSAPGSHNCLYRNRGDGSFEEVAKPLGVADVNQPGTGASMGSVWADLDNDGYEDLLVYKWGRPELFRNQGGRGFQRITDSAGLPDWVNAGCATWLDFNRDGLIDLFIAGYWPDNVRLEHVADTRIMPDSFEYAKNGGRKWLLQNRGNGRFEDVTEACGIDSTRWTLAVVAADFNGDSYPDLFLSNDYGVSELLVNENGRHFRDVSKESGVGYAPKSGMNAAVGDVLNQGALSIYESNIAEEGVLIQGNNLWVPSADNPLHFDNLAPEMGVELGGWSFGAQFGDLNNDGFADLILTNGYVSGARGTSYWYDFSEITGGHSRIISDARNWPAMNGRSLAGYQQKRIWINDGTGRFQEVAQAVGLRDTYDGRALALADLNNRGALDVLAANQRGPLRLYRNQVDPQRHWIAFELEGRASNRSAIGAQVRVHWNHQQQLQELVAASGFSAQNDRRLHFGLGLCDSVDRVEIRWPSGRNQVLDQPDVDAIHRIREPE